MRKAVALAGLGLVGGAVIGGRRHILARLLRLEPARNGVKVERNLRVPMADTVVLMADHYAPKAAGAFPTILMRTPYGRGLEAGFTGIGMIFLAQRMAERGYHVVIQNVRGRFDSEGEFYPFQHEEEDGKATLDWIAQQPWFNGSVGLWGASYFGYVQWAIADSPYVKALVPMITASEFYTPTFPAGAFNLDTSLRWTHLIETLGAKGTQPNIATAMEVSPRATAKKLEPLFKKLPLIEADQRAVGKNVSYYRDWLTHSDEADPYWQRIDHSHKLDDLNAPAHLISGWYDIFLAQLLADYTRLKEAGQNPHLTIGPWFHLQQYPILTTSLREGLAWFDTHLKGDAGRIRPLPVRLMVMGANEWREMENWPPPSREERYYLSTPGNLSQTVPSEPVSASHYRYDPANPTPNVGGAIFNSTGGPQDNRELEARPDVLIFSTEPLEDEVEVIGPVRLELYVQSSQPHTDFYGRLCDVLPNGTSLNVCDGLVRVTPESHARQPDGGFCVSISLLPTAYRFLKGHRIRVQVSSGAHPRWTRNLGTDEPLATGTAFVAADQSVYHDATRPSALILPVTT